MIKDDLYLSLRLMTFALINAAKSTGLEVKFEDITSYIDNALELFPCECDVETKEKLFTDIEYQFKITHTAGSVIFDDYENRNDWYSNEDIKNPYFWNRYKALLMANPAFNIRSRRESLSNDMVL